MTKKRSNTKRKGRYFLSSSEINTIRNTSNRLRKAPKVFREAKQDALGRPRNILPAKKDSKSFKALLKYFFVPLINSLDLGDDPDDKMSFKERVNYVFGAQHRDVVMAVATESFTMPGMVWFDQNPSRMVPPGPLASRILEGTPLMVRIDERMPERIDIERCDSTDGLMFTLNAVEYQTIYMKLKEVGGFDERLLPPGSEVK